jgi:redox-sensitive bicupin YhaK (pirin superfamily)
MSDIELSIVPRVRDLGDGFTVRRALPSAQRRLVGPFVFWDQMGPVLIAPGGGLDVRPHPHIGLATVTYLLDGEILHRDSEGNVRRIVPGDVNWMLAGRGIVHSERTPPDLRATGSRVFGFQAWVALPRDREESDPAFWHHAAAELPVLQDGGFRARLVAGSLGGARSPVITQSDTVYADVELAAGARFEVPAEHEERALYLADGWLQLEGGTFEPGQLLVLRPGAPVEVRTQAGARFLLIGGAALDGPRHIWWNLVHSSEDRIRQAAEDWGAGRFPGVPGETEFIPLPENGPPVVSYP